MAEVRSGSFDTNVIYWSSENRMFFRFSWSLSSQSTENNTSTISWTLQFLDLAAYTGNYRGTTDSWDGVIINGTRVLGKGIQGVFGNRWYYGNSKSGTSVIQHNDDGTKTFGVSVSIQSTNGDGWSGSGSYELPKIDVSKDMNIRIGNNIIKKAYVGTAEVKEVFIGETNIFPGYTRLEYIQSSGSQYIRTGVNDSNDSAICCKFYTANPNNNYIFGSRQNGSLMLYNGLYSNNHLEYNWQTITYTANNTIEMTQTVVETTNTIKINSQTFTKSTGSVSAYEIFIFACNNSSVRYYTGTTRCYYFKMYKGSTLLRDFIPVKRKTDNKVGLYDLVEHKFYGNSGSGDFVAGPEIYPMEGYTQLEWLKASGNYTSSRGYYGAMIDTNVVMANTVSVEIKFKIPTATPGWSALLGAASLNNNNNFYIVRPWRDTSKIAIQQPVNDSANYGIACNENEHTITYYGNDGRTVFDGTSYSTGNKIADTEYKTLALFGTNNLTKYDSCSSATIYYCKIWDNGNLVRNLIPCKRDSDDTLGMFDVVNNVFYSNINTEGEVFTAGPEI